MQHPFSWGFGLLALGVIILAVPASVEGPVLADVSPGHAVALLDAIGIMPLFVGSLFVYWGLWSNRVKLVSWVGGRLGVGLAGVFAAGLGLGLLVASSFGGFFWWWAIGAALFAGAIVAAAVVVTRPSSGSRS